MSLKRIVVCQEHLKQAKETEKPNTNLFILGKFLLKYVLNMFRVCKIVQ
jgi:hypothetical protein